MPRPPRPERFTQADVLDRVIQMDYFARVSAFELASGPRRPRPRPSRPAPGLSTRRPGRCGALAMIQAASTRADVDASSSPASRCLIRRMALELRARLVLFAGWPCSGRWPVVAGIPFLREGRESLRRAALDALDSGDEAGCPRHAPGRSRRLRQDASARGRVRSVGRSTARRAASRPSETRWPTWLSGRWPTTSPTDGRPLLTSRAWRFWKGIAIEGAAVVEVACGIGHYLRELALRDDRLHRGRCRLRKALAGPAVHRARGRGPGLCGCRGRVALWAESGDRQWPSAMMRSIFCPISRACWHRSAVPSAMVAES